MKQSKHLAMFILALLASISICSSAYNIQGLSGFKCPGVTKLNSAVRLNEKNEVQCFSINGSDCATFSNDQDCRSFVENKVSKLLPVTCGKKDSGWCKDANKFFFKKWLCNEVTGLKTGIKLSKNGDVQCLSKNGKDCVWGDLGNKLCKKIQHCSKTRKRMKKLTCGKEHAKIWGHTGYNFPTGHWCKKGFAFYFYTGHWLCKSRTGIATPVRLADNGDIECLSNDRRNCFWNVDNSQQCDKTITKYGNKNRNLRCGKHHRRLYRMSGYRRRGHWCSATHKSVYNKSYSLIYIVGGGQPLRVITSLGAGRSAMARLVTKIAPAPSSGNSKSPPHIGKSSNNLGSGRSASQRLTKGRGSFKRPLVVISHDTKRRMIEKHGEDWKQVFKRKFGIFWKFRVKYGNKWKLKLRRKFGDNWRYKLRKKIERFRKNFGQGGFGFRRRSLVRISHETKRRMIERHGHNWKIIFRKRYGIFWKHRVKYGENWQVKLRRKFGPNWRITLRKRIQRFRRTGGGRGFGFRGGLRRRGLIRISHKTKQRMIRLHGVNWKSSFRKRYGILWRWRVKYGANWHVRLRRKFGHNWRITLRKRIKKFRSRIRGKIFVPKK